MELAAQEAQGFYLFVLDVGVCIVLHEHGHTVDVPPVGSTLKWCSSCIILHVWVDLIFYQYLADISVSPQCCPVEK